jgi:hypothetical protein
MTTGSYEESLPMEGIPDHHGARRSRGALTSGLGGHRILATRINLPKGDMRRECSSRETWRGARVKQEMIATGVSEARSHRHRGKKTPTLPSPNVVRPGDDEWSVE